MKQTVSELYAEANKSGPGPRTWAIIGIGVGALTGLFELVQLVWPMLFA